VAMLVLALAALLLTNAIQLVFARRGVA
jgi:hypothetical protein